MNRGFYPRLAWTGMKQNRRLYLPYLLTCTGITAMFYILMGLSVSSVLPQMSGGRSTALIMSLGSVVIAVFALIFLFYTHSFLIRRRSREFGLYNVLGMGKGNIARILLWETLLTYAGTTVTGLALGVALSKLAELGLMNLLRSRITYTFTVNAVSLLITLALFAAVHTLIFLHALWQLHRVSAVALLHSESVGEKPPRARWLLAVLGLVLLGGAYWLAVSIREPLEALLWFFAAVIMVILGTYLLFITGSVALCRALQKNPRYYYRPSHFVSVSSMAYRMKRNGAGLASVCVLATMVLVMLSSTTCMYYGVEDALHQRYARDINVECYFGGDVSRMSDENLNALRTALTGAAAEMGSSFDNERTYRAAYVYGVLTPEGVLRPALAETDGVMESTRVTLLPLSDYNAVMGADLTLAADEALVYGNRMTFTAERFTVGGTAWRVRGQLDSCPVNGAAAADVTPSLFVVVPDFDSAANTMMDAMSGGTMDVQLRWYCSFDSDLPAEEQFGGGSYEEGVRDPQSLTDAVQWALYDAAAGGDIVTGWEVDSLAANRSDFYGSYGGLFFLGIMLSVVFLLAAVSIIYYKQICEGYEDQSRFDIMQKVGMTKRDIRRSINSQLLTVFFLPMALAGVHLCFAFPFIHKLLLLFNLSNTPLLIGTTVVSYVAFALLYTLAYKLTSNAYYHIVSGAVERE